MKFDSKLTYISLFSSAGVGCYGFKLNDFECIATNEIIQRRLDVQRFNNKCKYESGYICGDITCETVKTQLLNEVDMWKKSERIKDVTVLIATPPCQGMSVANHKKAADEIVRNSLVIESIKLISTISPQFFIFENVPAFMKTICTDIDQSEKTIGDAIDLHLGKDYSIYSKIINFKNYGACSSRMRTIVIGVRHDLADFISPFELFPDYIQEKSLRDTIGHLKSLTEMGEIDDCDIYHSFRPYPERMRLWITDLSEGESAFEQSDISKIPHQVIDGKIVINKQKNGDKYKRQYWDKVGPCIHTRNDQLASQNTIHPKDDRVFSIRELMLMMSIPYGFKWSSIEETELNRMSIDEKKSYLKKEEIKIRQCLGEAVPTAIMMNIAKKITDFFHLEHLKDSEIKQLIDSNNLSDFNMLSNFISSNQKSYGISTLSKIAEYSNAKRENNAAFFTDKSIMTEIIKNLPDIDNGTIRVLEPSVGTGNFLPFIFKKYESVENLIIDIVDIDNDVLSVVRQLFQHNMFPSNVTLNFINDDFLSHNFEHKYDIIIGNPPFSKLHSNDARIKKYHKQFVNTSTTNIAAFFLEKALSIANYVSLVFPKFLLNTPEFKETRTIIENYKVNSIIDFGESGFKGVLVETICININTKLPPSKVHIQSLTERISIIQNQKYIFDHKFPYWIIYRDSFFDTISKKMTFNVFTAFRDRQITNRILYNKGDIPVIKSRNISDDASEIISIDGYDSYTSEHLVKNFSVYQYLDNGNVYLTPNMTYKPRVIKKPLHTLVNGSVAILTLKDGYTMSEGQMKYFSSDEYRKFYRIARNYQTRSLNVDSNSVFFFGLIKED